MTGLPCDLCVEARASSARGGVVECACGEVYAEGRWVDPSPQASAGASPSGPVWPAPSVRVTGAELVYRADPDAPMERRPPSGLVRSADAGPLAALTATLRQLLAELRPFRTGPLGWPPHGEPPPSPPDTIEEAGRPSRPVLGPLVRAAMRVQSSPAVPTILPGANVDGREAPEPTRAERKALGIWLIHCPATITLRWLQQHGTLAERTPQKGRPGRKALDVLNELAAALAPADLQAKWRAIGLGSYRALSRAWARARIEEALAWWSAETWIAA